MRFFSIVSELSCCLLLFLPLKSSLHPYYIGVSELRLLPAEKRIELSVRLFTDDLESALQRTYNTSSDLLKGVKDSAVNQRLGAYLRKKLRVQLGETVVKLNFIGYEIEADASWCYLEASYTGTAAQLSFQNLSLFDVLPEQQHIVHLKAGDKSKSTRLSLEKPEVTWTW